MPEITISQESYLKVVEFKQVVEAIIEEEINIEDYMQLILDQGMDSMLADLLGPQEHSTLLQSFQQLASRYPTQIYSYVVEMLKRGAASQGREETKRRILGFLPRDDES